MNAISSNPRVSDAGFITLQAAADYLGNGAIETNRYESEIVDIVRRESVFLTRVTPQSATGHPHRFFDQTAIAQGGFTDPRNITATPSGPTRTERSVYIKAVSAQSNFGLFDVDVTRMQGQFASLEAKDIEDITSGIVITEASSVWNGTATAITDSSTQSFCGILTQITNQATISLGSSIIDGLKAKVAAMLANVTQSVRPTAIYINPIINDLIDREAKASKIELGTVEVAAGVVVTAINTQAGVLPLIPDPFIPATTDTSYGFAAPGSGNSNYFAVILTEKMLERPVVHGADGNLNPRIFQLGLLSGLQGQYVGVHFSAVVAKRADAAHAVVAIVRPTVTAG
ncbi:MAG TPA: hypothetical protein VF503_12220 [Sphingobium sp.]|uniref:hypothetical protein n=1 Tax=Sphingobium sp. TaxID=1912891 RepID=UPI002ED3B81D